MPANKLLPVPDLPIGPTAIAALRIDSCQTTDVVVDHQPVFSLFLTDAADHRINPLCPAMDVPWEQADVSRSSFNLRNATRNEQKQSHQQRCDRVVQNHLQSNELGILLKVDTDDDASVPDVSVVK